MAFSYPIPLIRLRQDFVYDSSLGILYWNTGSRCGHVAGSLSRGYRRVQYRGKNYLVHRLVWAYVYGDWPKNQIDHIDGDKTNNRITNLRDVTATVNQQNQRRQRMGMCGVDYDPRYDTWRVRLQYNKKPLFIGSFKTKSRAKYAYQLARYILHA